MVALIQQPPFAKRRLVPKHQPATAGERCAQVATEEGLRLLTNYRVAVLGSAHLQHANDMAQSIHVRFTPSRITIPMAF